MDPAYNPMYEILEFDTVTAQWKLVDHLMQPRYQHSLSVVSDAAQYCSAVQPISHGTFLMFME